jgi:hypothetical protein
LELPTVDFNIIMALVLLMEESNFAVMTKMETQTGSGAHPASYPMDTWGSFPGGKAAGA